MPKTHLRREAEREIGAQRFDITPQGLYLPRLGAMAAGEYFGRVNGGAWAKEGDNLIVTEGFAHMLNVAFGSTPKPAGYYLAIFSGNTAPAPNWTAASFAAVASEIVSMTEGHTGATRPAWTAANTNTGSIDNMATVASLTIATAGTLNVTGAALLTSNQRGGTTGALVSASLYAAARTFQNGDVYELGYRINLTT
ncbi:hypothetical protein A4F85_04600 [Delftia sp. GW456-R20]|uniref:hypothetical protein n=1 Tax=Delftia sp. GW456-R20 TaxID=1827145 RepID=UPI0007AE855F|nr:hypothetical protein [Delftia sp. GW456-R20]KZK32001.1 hypothetical protein A4F85_04600 [Delftia sp. GW456-R20]